MYNIAVIFGSCEDNDASWELLEIDFFENGEAVFVRHAQVEEEDIGHELAQHLDAIVPIGSLADDDDCIVAVEELAQTFTEDEVVVCDQYPNR